MKATTLFSLLLVCLLLGSFTVGQACFLDDDFEGAAPFVNQHYPVADDNVTPPSVTPQGVFLRAWANDANNKEEIINQFTGTQTSNRFFRGTKSYKLSDGQLVKFGNRAGGTVAIQGANVPMLFQFALSTDAATAGKAVGTKIGHFKLDYSLTDTSLTEDSAIFNFEVAANGKLAVKSADNGALIKEIECGPGYWTLLSFTSAVGVTAADPNAGNGNIFVLYDPLTGKHKGLQPINPAVPPANPVVAADFNYYGAGIQVFADANTTATTVRPQEMDAKWGLTDEGAANEYNTLLQGWELTATAGNTIYIDNICWNIGLFTDPNRMIDQEQAARMEEFTLATTEPAGPPVASARIWNLY